MPPARITHTAELKTENRELCASDWTMGKCALINEIMHKSLNKSKAMKN